MMSDINAVIVGTYQILFTIKGDADHVIQCRECYDMRKEKNYEKSLCTKFLF